MEISHSLESQKVEELTCQFRVKFSDEKFVGEVGEKVMVVEVF